MKLSKYLIVEETLPLKKFRLARIKHNKCKHNLYLVCTSKQPHLLFEIIKGNQLDASYDACYLVALTQEREHAIEHITRLIDDIYNLKTLDYLALKQEKR